jgi:BirA family transcriptional regulator, biotin operon repressor / biotin---[acetyl-CoA-carboxylase] ligase
MLVQEIPRYLNTEFFGRKIYAFDRIDSTNKKARDLLQKGAAEGTMVIADEQTDGRGRFDRRWISEKGKNLTFSLILRPQIGPRSFGLLSLYAGMAVAEAVETKVNLKPVCKWPNDLLFEGKKFCGILAEASAGANRKAGVVIGIGINVNQELFPADIGKRATSLLIVKKEKLDRYQVLSAVLESLEKNYLYVQGGEVSALLERWSRYADMFGKKISIRCGEKILSGSADRLDSDGGLIIKTSNGEVKILAGEVSLCC